MKRNRLEQVGPDVFSVLAENRKELWKGTNPNCRRPHGVRDRPPEHPSNFVQLTREHLARRQKEEDVSRSSPGVWIPSHPAQRGLEWGTINPFPSEEIL